MTSLMPSLIQDQVGPWVMLIHPHFPRSLLTTESGARMAELLWQGLEKTKIPLIISQEFQIESEADVLQDLEFLLSELSRSGLLPDSPHPVVQNRDSRPENLTIYVTGQCNLRCKHCAVVEGIIPKDKITTADILRLITEYTRLSPRGTVSLLGGEPFMHQDILTILEHANDHAPKVTVSTNGTFVTPEIANKVGILKNVFLQVSLDGADQEVHDFIRGNNSYKSTWNAINAFAQTMGDRLTVATTLTKASLEQLQELITQCDERKIHSLRFINLNKLKAAETHWETIAPDPEELKRALRYLIFQSPKRLGAYTKVAASLPGFVPNRKETQDHWCPLGSMMVVNAQGTAYNCPILETPETEVGSIHGKPFEKLAQTPENTNARNWMLSRQEQVGECRACAWRTYCGGGCTAYMALRSGDVRRNDEFCGFRRNLYREYFLQSHGISVEEFPEQ